MKACFRDSRLALNSNVGLADPAIVEIIGIAGFDAATIDLDHMTFNIETVREMIVAAERVGITPIVRVSPGEWRTALQALDAGAQGIQVTHVRDAAMAAEAVSIVRYAPLGRRAAFSTSRAARFGATPWHTYTEQANDEVLLTVMIEDEEAIEQVAEIASVPGVDLVTVGAYDLAESLGIHSDNDPRLRAELKKISERVLAVGKARFGLSIGQPVLSATLRELIALGVSYVNVLPPPEVRLRAVLEEHVRQMRREAESCSDTD